MQKAAEAVPVPVPQVLGRKGAPRAWRVRRIWASLPVAQAVPVAQAARFPAHGPAVAPARKADLAPRLPWSSKTPGGHRKALPANPCEMAPYARLPETVRPRCEHPLPPGLFVRPMRDCPDRGAYCCCLPIAYPHAAERRIPCRDPVLSICMEQERTTRKEELSSPGPGESTALCLGEPIIWRSRPSPAMALTPPFGGG